MINNGITRDIKLHALSDDTSRLAFTWLSTFALAGPTHKVYLPLVQRD